ncbi:hypothetical protein V6N13_111390 [Hibiscus sabdariffa]
MSKNQKGSAQQDNHGVKQKLKKNCLESTVKEGVSYKDALLTETLSIKVEEAQRGDVRSPCPPNSYGPKPIPCSIPSSAQLWLKDCLVGEIKGMYDVEFVQQALRSDGFNVKSCRFEDYGHALNEVAADSFPDAKDLKEAIIRPHDPDVARANLFQYNTENEGGRWL